MAEVAQSMRPAEALAADQLELTILMPCLNEARTLGSCIAKARRFLESAGIAGEVLIADNGSTDGSQALAQGCGARVIHVPERGYGAAPSEDPLSATSTSPAIPVRVRNDFAFSMHPKIVSASLRQGMRMVNSS